MTTWALKFSATWVTCLVRYKTSILTARWIGDTGDLGVAGDARFNTGLQKRPVTSLGIWPSSKRARPTEALSAEGSCTILVLPTAFTLLEKRSIVLGILSANVLFHNWKRAKLSIFLQVCQHLPTLANSETVTDFDVKEKVKLLTVSQGALDNRVPWNLSLTCLWWLFGVETESLANSTLPAMLNTTLLPVLMYLWSVKVSLMRNINCLRRSFSTSR